MSNFVSFYHAVGKEEYLHNMSLSNSALFRSACGYPTYTTLVTSFQGCLDYIFVDKTLKVHKVSDCPEPLTFVLQNSLHGYFTMN